MVPPASPTPTLPPPESAPPTSIPLRFHSRLSPALPRYIPRIDAASPPYRWLEPNEGVFFGEQVAVGAILIAECGVQKGHHIPIFAGKKTLVLDTVSGTFSRVKTAKLDSPSHLVLRSGYTGIQKGTSVTSAVSCNEP